MDIGQPGSTIFQVFLVISLKYAACEVRCSITHMIRPRFDMTPKTLSGVWLSAGKRKETLSGAMWREKSSRDITDSVLSQTGWQKMARGKMLMRHRADSSFPLFSALKRRKGTKAKMTRAEVGGGRGVTMTRVCQECLWRTCCAAGKPMDQVPPCQLPCSAFPNPTVRY